MTNNYFYLKYNENAREATKQTAGQTQSSKNPPKNSLKHIIKNQKMICKKLLAKFKRIAHKPEECQKLVGQILDQIYSKLEEGYNRKIIYKCHFQLYINLLKQLKTRNPKMNEKIEEFINYKLTRNFRANKNIGIVEINMRQNSQNLCCFLHLPVTARGQKFTFNSFDNHCKKYAIGHAAQAKGALTRHICAMLNAKQAVLFIGIDGRVGRGLDVQVLTIQQQHFQKIKELAIKIIRNHIFPKRIDPEKVVKFQFLKLEQKRQDNLVFGVGRIYVNTWKFNQTFFVQQQLENNKTNYKLYVQPEGKIQIKEIYKMIHKNRQLKCIDMSRHIRINCLKI